MSLHLTTSWSCPNWVLALLISFLVRVPAAADISSYFFDLQQEDFQIVKALKAIFSGSQVFISQSIEATSEASTRFGRLHNFVIVIACIRVN